MRPIAVGIRHSPGERIDEKSNDDHRDDNAAEVDRGDLIDLGLRRALQIFMTSVTKDAEIRAAKLDFVPTVRAVAAGADAATATSVSAGTQHCNSKVT